MQNKIANYDLSQRTFTNGTNTHSPYTFKLGDVICKKKTQKTKHITVLNWSSALLTSICCSYCNTMGRLMQLLQLLIWPLWVGTWEQLKMWGWLSIWVTSIQMESGRRQTSYHLSGWEQDSRIRGPRQKIQAMVTLFSLPAVVTWDIYCMTTT